MLRCHHPSGISPNSNANVSGLDRAEMDRARHHAGQEMLLQNAPAPMVGPHPLKPHSAELTTSAPKPELTVQLGFNIDNLA